MTHRRNMLVAFGAVLWSSVASAHPPSIVTPTAEKATQEEIVAFRKRVVDTITAKDAGMLRDLYAPSFVHTHTSGKMDGRDARIVAALAGEPVIETAVASELVIRVPNDWTAIATGLSPIKSMSDGKTYGVRWMAVYVRTGTGWAIAASQATRGPHLQP